MNKFLLFALIYGLTACHVGQDYTRKEILSDDDVQSNLNLQGKYKAGISPNWYEIFNDNDLNTLLSYAAFHNLTIKQTVERLKQSRLAFEIHAKDYYPKIEGNGEYDFNKVDTPHKYAFDTNLFKVGLDVAWELDIWGKGDYISDQYFEFMNKISYSLLDVKASVTAEITQNFINLRLAQEKLYIVQQNLKLQREILQTVLDKYNAGMSDDLDLSQAQFSVEETKTQIPTLKFSIENYKNSLAVLLGVAPNNLPINLNKYSRNITAIPFKYNVQNFYNLPLDIVRNRPDIKAAETDIKIQNAKVNESITDLYPRISLGATFGFISPSGHELFSNKSQIYSYNPQFSIPIWNWKQLKNNIELQRHIKEEYILNYNEALLTALTEIKNVLYSIEQAYKRNIYARNSYVKMQNIMILTKKKYKNGLVDFTDVALAEKDLLTSQNRLAETNAQILENITLFYKSIGGGYH